MENSSFEKLKKVNVNDKLSRKMDLKYLSWADAWNLLKTNCPNAFYTIYERDISIKETILVEGKTIEKTYTNKVPYFTDGSTGFVKVGVTVDNVEYVEMLPIMDHRNQSISISLIKSVDVNRAIQRAFVKACARHGLGLYVYAGEDFPEDSSIPQNSPASDNELITLQNKIIANIQEISQRADINQDDINSYLIEQLHGIRVSQTTTDHIPALKNICNFLNNKLNVK